MKKFIICTSINKPTLAIKKFDALRNWKLVVVGDKKTPKNYKLKNGIYLSPRKQELIDKKLSDLIGWNCIQRRNFGLLYAWKSGADIVAVVDDDNIPYNDWGEKLLINQKIKTNYFQTNELAFDPISVTNYKNLWHRGFPIQILGNRKNVSKQIKIITPQIQADFWDGDPDIDAICRMEYHPSCKFKKKFFLLHQIKYLLLILKTPFYRKKFYHIIFYFLTLVAWMIFGLLFMLLQKVLKLFITNHPFFKKEISTT